MRTGVPVVLALVFAAAAPARAEPAKKEQWLADKRAHQEGRTRGLASLRRRQRRPPEPVLTLRNLWTQELLPVQQGQPPPAAVLDRFLRCHFTNQHRAMDHRLLGVLLRAARRFHARVIEIVSGYRSPKYNLILRKKGHEVARRSQHVAGHAIDFRIPEVPTRRLLGFVRRLRLGGVGYYPGSRFVHADTGPRRFWRGD